MDAILDILGPLAAGRERFLVRDGQRGLVPDDIPATVPDARVPLYKTALCKNHSSGRCFHGARCWFAHGAEELRRYGHFGSRPR